MEYYPINQGIQIVFHSYALSFVALAFCINFWRYQFYPFERLLYHFLYHFGIEIRRFPWGFIEKRFFSISKKALRCEDLLSFMSLYWENETRSLCYDTKFHFYISPLSFAFKDIWVIMQGLLSNLCKSNYQYIILTYIS